MAGVRMMADLGLNPVTSADLPILRADPMLTAGSLILFTAGDSQGGMESVPADNGAIYNAAWREAAALIGSGDSTTLASVFQDFHQAADAIFELTEHGAIHGIYSQVNNTNGARGAYIEPAAAILTYLADNPDNGYYFSQWARISRQRGDTDAGYMRISTLTPNTNGTLMRLASNGHLPTTGELLGTSAEPGLNDLGVPILRTLGAQGWVTTDPTPGVSTSIRAGLAVWGNILAWQTSQNNEAPSQMYYRVYLEDLTESGRTYAEAAARDLELFEAAFAEGGRYYDDSYTDPATFP